MELVMRVVSAAEVRDMTLLRMGFPPRIVNASSDAPLASLLRRTAAFLCPCPRRTLTDSVVQSLVGLLAESESAALQENLDEVLEAMVAHGDLLEAGS